MNALTAILALVVLTTTAVKVLSAVYFEVAYTVMNKLFPQGYLPAGEIRIPNHNAASYLFIRWLHSGSHIANWLQYLIVISVFYSFGWVVSVVYLLFVIIGVKIMMAIACNVRLTQTFAVELMYVHVERKVRLRQFRWDDATNEAGERMFELLYREALVLLDTLPQRPGAVG